MLKAMAAMLIKKVKIWSVLICWWMQLHSPSHLHQIILEYTVDEKRLAIWWKISAVNFINNLYLNWKRELQLCKRQILKKIGNQSSCRHPHHVFNVGILFIVASWNFCYYSCHFQWIHIQHKSKNQIKTSICDWDYGTPPSCLWNSFS